MAQGNLLVINENVCLNNDHYFHIHLLLQQDFDVNKHVHEKEFRSLTELYLVNENHLVVVEVHHMIFLFEISLARVEKYVLLFEQLLNIIVLLI
jgi:hypothetical protein